jgi:hypothetical protein
VKSVKYTYLQKLIVVFVGCVCSFIWYISITTIQIVLDQAGWFRGNTVKLCFELTNQLTNLNSGVQHPVARVSIRFKPY